MTTTTINGFNLTAAQVVAVARDHAIEVNLAASSRAALKESRDYIESTWMHDEAPMMYSFNTGVGMLKDTRVKVQDIVLFQTQLIKAHACGMGEPFSEEVSRATMLLRANAFASNYSAPRVEVVDRLLGFVNAGIHPIMPQKGSVGASGDLAPLAYLAAAIAGFEEAEVMYKGQRMSAPDAIRASNVGPVVFELKAKDASALINGCTVSLAVALLAAADARNMLSDACLSLGLTLEAMRAEMSAFDPRIHEARPHAGQIKTAAIIRDLLDGSTRTTHEARAVQFPEELRRTDIPYTARIQDVYSLRCAPQVYGRVFDALDYIDTILDKEVNSATDNPLIFGKDGGGFEIISGGNFHGQYLAQAMDLLAMAVADLGSIVERRVARLIDPTLSWGLPRNLMSGVRGVNTGYPVMQCSLSSLVMENRTLCMPGSVDSIPAKGNSEDHVSNSTWCARKAATVVSNTQYIVGVEMLLASQALTMTENLLPGFVLGKGTQAAYESVRSQIPACLDGDRWLHNDLEVARSFIVSGSVRKAVIAKIGEFV
ncbi:aromatic amino acid lyase [Duganella sp. BJB488]|uniref:HAL/PAL/TAL family ammonia-lyase n=1 Tax=unclassified Duganella TaxID=2636909 RepID=UPI000E3427D2|nr:MULTISPECIES: aromatic amino acid ammonia-lyase [unclassified Duganella]RFP11064.1 aromatic amino acid lyase [Duganella sp. BJB489]RFP14388.1 aromatic amino acid lyase [Duganella sp. BJB488]RFP30323.1 aromatic amino acid lyase [Duganella sp. BJB480]